MEVEFDLKKSEANLAKHGIALDDAAAIWGGTVVNIPAKNIDGEKRTKTLGKIEDIIYAVVWTERNGRRRLISARRATKKEGSLYHGTTNH